ncbi:MAG TPA: cytochrome D1 domain-containing protein [Archangium sp.]|nr:cytochrome D1 domain-containing protein [Archangium sp.]
MTSHDSSSPPKRPWRTAAAGALCGLLVAGFMALSAKAPKKPVPAARPAPTPVQVGATERLEKNGVVVELSVLQPGLTATEKRPLLEGDHAEVRFRMTDATSGLPLRGLSPSAWMDMGQLLAGTAQQTHECKDRVALYLKGLVGIRPLIDLNSYYLLVMNQDPSISVIDPLVGMTGKTSLFATVVLERPGADWVKSRDGRRLFVSMPRAGKVAVVDTESFRVSAQVEAGQEPTRVALQPDGRYLWVGDGPHAAAGSGVTVIDTESLETVARIPTGRGYHELAFTPDDRFAFVSNREEGTVSVIDIARLAKVKDLRTGTLPISVAYSSLSGALYVADGKEGTISAIDGERLEVRSRMTARPGLGPMRFTQDGRWGMVVNPSEHAVYVIDAAGNQLVHTLSVGGQPYQVGFTRAFAYVRLLDSERVEMINLATLGGESKPTVQGFGAGALAPQLAGDLSLADSISQAATDAAVFVVNPADNTTYFYMEGMNAPMGSFGNYGHNARAVSVVDRSLQEIEPGVYSARIRIPAAGRYDLAFLMDSPRFLHCFSLEAKENPAMKQARSALELEYLDFPARLTEGEVPRLRFKLSEPGTHEPVAGLGDVTVLTYAAPGRLRAEVTAREVEDGVYEARPTLASAGAYYLYVSVPSKKVDYGGLPYRTLWVASSGQKSPPAQ